MQQNIKCFKSDLIYALHPPLPTAFTGKKKINKFEKVDMKVDFHFVSVFNTSNNGIQSVEACYKNLTNELFEPPSTDFGSAAEYYLTKLNNIAEVRTTLY